EDAGKAYRFDLSIEVRGRVKGEGKVRVRTFPASPIATVTFDPDVVAARVIYHGLSDWLRWRKKDKTIKRTRTWREVYSGNPWRDPVRSRGRGDGDRPGLDPRRGGVVRHARAPRQLPATGLERETDREGKDCLSRSHGRDDGL